LADLDIENKCIKLSMIIEKAKKEIKTVNKARYSASDDGHKALLSDVEKALAAAQDERVPLGEIGKNVEKVQAEFDG
jgi:hypothetical protein